MTGTPQGTAGKIEPLTGRVWNERGAGQGYEPWTLCWAPGAQVPIAGTFTIGERGLWAFSQP